MWAGTTQANREERIRANEENLFGLIETFVGDPRIDVRRDDVALRTISDIPFPLFNSVLGADLSEANVDATVIGILAPYVDRGLPAMWWVGPRGRTPNLVKALERQGLRPVASQPCMSLALDTFEPEPTRIRGFRIERVWNRGLAADWTRAVRVAFGFPKFALGPYAEAMIRFGFGPEVPFEHWVGYLDGTPVAASSLFRCAGVAGLYNLAVLPSVRGRRIGRAMTQAPLVEARDEGTSLAVLQASAAGYPIYVDLGFQQDGSLSQHVLAPPRE